RRRVGGGQEDVDVVVARAAAGAGLAGVAGLLDGARTARDAGLDHGVRHRVADAHVHRLSFGQARLAYVHTTFPLDARTSLGGCRSTSTAASATRGARRSRCRPRTPS